jgi:hypothetical protein
MWLTSHVQAGVAERVTAGLTVASQGEELYDFTDTAIRLQTTTLQHKIGYSYYYTQFNSHAHPFTYYLSRKQQNMLPNKLKCTKQQTITHSISFKHPTSHECNHTTGRKL